MTDPIKAVAPEEDGVEATPVLFFQTADKVWHSARNDGEDLEPIAGGEPDGRS